jgi:hypothetical protein
MYRYFLTLTAVALAACVQVDNTAIAASPCGANRAAGYVGRVATPAVRVEVAQAVGHTRIRWIRPGDAVTMDYSEARLNADLDSTGKILGFRCG